MVVIAVVVTVYTAGAAAGAMGTAATATTTAGTTVTVTTAGAATAAAGGGIGATMATGTAVLGGTYGATAAAVAGAVGGFAGSVASQAVGSAMGAASFNWQAALVSGAAGGASAGFGVAARAGTFGTTLENARYAQAAAAGVGQMTSYGVSRSLGMDASFSWTAVAAAALSAGATYNIGGVPITEGGTSTGRLISDFGGRLLSGAISGTTNRLMGMGKQNWGQIAADAFGNALGNAAVAGISNWQASRMVQRAAVQSGMPSLFDPNYWPEWLYGELQRSREAVGYSSSSPGGEYRVPQMVPVPEGTVKDAVSAIKRSEVANDYVNKVGKMLRKQSSFPTPDVAARAFRNIFAPMSGYLGLEFGANIEPALGGGYVLDSIVISDNFSPTDNIGWNVNPPYSKTAVAWAHTHPEINFTNKSFSFDDLIWSVKHGQNAYVFYPEGYGRRFDYSHFKSSTQDVREVYYYGQDKYAPPFE